MIKLPLPSDQFLEALDRETQRAYSEGATTVWAHVGVGEGLPNEAIYNTKTGFYDIRPKSK